MLDPDTVLSRSEDISYRVLTGQAVIFSIVGEEILVLNDVGTRVLELTDGERSVGELVECLLAEYEVEEETLSADVVAHLEDLLEAKVLQGVR